MAEHLEQIALEPEQLRRWADRAKALGAAGSAVALEVGLVTSDASRHNLGRLLRAARHVATVAGGTGTRQTAAALVAEIEEALK